jgi:hypothetical protein
MQQEAIKSPVSRLGLPDTTGHRHESAARRVRSVPPTRRLGIEDWQAKCAPNLWCATIEA